MPRTQAPYGPLPLVVVPGMLCGPDLWPDVDFPEDRPVRHLALGKPDIGALADDLLASVTGPFVVAGLSLGGIVAFEALRRAPDRVAGLCVMSTNAGAPRPEQYAAWRAMDGLIADGRFAEVVEETLPGMFPASRPPGGAASAPIPAPAPGAASVPASTSASVLAAASASVAASPPASALVAAATERYRRMARAVGPEAARAQLAAQATRRDAVDALRGARCPAVVLSGTRDALCPPDFHRVIAGALPDAELREVPGAGHLLPWQAPSAVSAALRDLLARVREPVFRTHPGPTAPPTA
ncbi:alpha/beta fold hydrolase [Streptomyces sp. SYP-A7185]|uniref:alpha/beta fold hydrolase n=1 Tax=Streptomyces sp. SYP-A7185 TaxID=3040076 RepID=UPI0038F76D53